MERELGKINSWGGKWRVGVEEGIGVCIKVLIIERFLEMGREIRWGGVKEVISEGVLGIGVINYEVNWRKGDKLKIYIRIFFELVNNFNKVKWDCLCLVYFLFCDFCGIVWGKGRLIWFSELMG